MAEHAFKTVPRWRLVAPLAVAALAATACGSSSGGSQARVASQPSAASSSAGTSSSAAGGGVYPMGGTSSSAGTSSAGTMTAAATVQTTKGPLGTFLTDASGKTLYLFEKDSGMTSTCYDACAQVWPPLLTKGSSKAAGAASASMLGTTKRKDGTTQVTYDGHPLYYFSPDSGPGDTKGEGNNGFGAKWYVVNPSGAAIKG